MSKVVLAVVVGVLVLVGAWWMASPPAEPPRPAAPAPRASTVTARDPTPAPASARVAAAASPVDDEPATSAAPDPEAAWRALDGELVGRLLANGAPLAGRRVALLRGAEDLGRRGSWTRILNAPAPIEEASASTTDGEGRFALDGLRPGRLHALAVDPGGPHGSLRAIAQVPDVRATLDLGDVELGPLTRITGRVEDEDGEPLPGATVRAICAALPAPLPMLGVQHLDPGGAIARSEEGGPEALPRWLGQWWDRLPIPTARTDSAGRFAIDGVPRGLASLLATAPGRLGEVRVAPTGASEERDVGAIELSEGRVLAGRVVDVEGAPIAGAEVRVGPWVVALRAPILGPLLRADDAGAFRVTGLPWSGAVTVAARREGGHAWTILDADEDEECEVVLPSGAALSVWVEAEDGATLDGVSVAATRFGGDVGSALAAPGEARRAARSDRPGRFVIEDLAPGRYLVIVESEGVAAPWAVDLPPEGAELRAVVRPPVDVEVRVVEDEGGAPVEGAVVRIEGDGAARPGSGAAAVTAADGVARLRLRPSSDRSSVVGLAEVVSDIELYAEHPVLGVGRGDVDVADLREGARRFELRVFRHGALRGRVRCSDAPPPSPLLVVAYEDDGAFGFLSATPYPAKTDARGDYVLPRLPPGSYVVKVLPSVLDGDLVANAAAVADPDALAVAEARVRPGKATELDLHVLPVDSPIAGRLTGAVRVDGHPAAGARIWVRPSSGPSGGPTAGILVRDARADERGVLTVAGLAPGTAHVEVDLGEGPAVFAATIPVAAGATERLDLDLRVREVSVVVLDPKGAPAPHAEVRLSGLGDARGLVAEARTGSEGEATLRAPREGTFRIEAFDPDVGRAHALLEVPSAAASPAPRTLALEGGAAFAGTLAVPSAWEREMNGFPLPSLRFAFEEDGERRTLGLRMWPPQTRQFEVFGLPPGAVEVVLELPTFHSDPVRVVLPPEGIREAELRFE